MKGVSPFIASVLLIVMTVSAGALLAMWYMGLIKLQASNVGNEAEEKTTCSYGGIRILTETIRCDFSGSPPATKDYLNFTVENSGSINLYNLKMQIYIQGVSYSFDVYETATNSTFNSTYPLRPDERKTVSVNITQNAPLANPDWIRLITQCSGVNSGNIESVDCTP